MAYGDRWSREHTIAALSLYAQIPFGTIHHRNPRVIALAEVIGRTPSSVSYRLTNLASLDPDLRARGIKGMSNASALDREVWDEFYGRWDDLAHATADVLLDEQDAPASERFVETTQRIGQAFFRRAVFAAWDDKCAVTGLGFAPLLRASHIVPWAADKQNRINPRNGLCLNALHDAAFDRGLMTIDESMRVVYARDLRAALRKSEGADFMREYEGRSLLTPVRLHPDKALLERHRTTIFIDA